MGEKQYGKILEGAAKETAKHGYSLVFMDSENDQKTEKKWLEEVKNQHMKGLVLVPVCSENKNCEVHCRNWKNRELQLCLQKKMLKMQEWMAFLQMNSGVLMKVSAVWWKKAAKR